MALAASALEIIEATAHRNGVARVRPVWLEIGAVLIRRMAMENQRLSRSGHFRGSFIPRPGDGRFIAQRATSY